MSERGGLFDRLVYVLRPYSTSGAAGRPADRPAALSGPPEVGEWRSPALAGNVRAAHFLRLAAGTYENFDSGPASYSPPHKASDPGLVSGGGPARRLLRRVRPTRGRATIDKGSSTWLR